MGANIRIVSRKEQRVDARLDGEGDYGESVTQGRHDAAVIRAGELAAENVSLRMKIESLISEVTFLRGTLYSERMAHVRLHAKATGIVMLLLLATAAQGAIYDWRNGQKITEATAKPGADLSAMDLRYADLAGKNLVGVDFSASDLSHADLSGATVSGQGFTNYNTDFSGANLSFADLSYLNCRAQVIQEGMSFVGADLTGTNFDHAILWGAVWEYSAPLVQPLPPVRAAVVPEPGALGVVGAVGAGMMLARRRQGAV